MAVLKRELLTQALSALIIRSFRLSGMLALIYLVVGCGPVTAPKDDASPDSDIHGDADQTTQPRDGDVNESDVDVAESSDVGPEGDLFDDGDIYDADGEADVETVRADCRTDEDCPRLECHQRICEDGVCSLLPDSMLDGTPCEDGDLCTTGDLCEAGSCISGGPLSCSFCTVSGESPEFFRSFPSQAIRRTGAGLLTSDGDLAFTGISQGSLWHLRLEADGGTLVDLTYGNPRYGDKGYALVEIGSEILLAGYSQVILPQLAWTVRVDATGGTLESRAYFETEGGSFHGVVDLGAEGLLLLANAGGEATLLRVDDAGEPVWEQRYFDMAMAYGLAGLVSLSDGTYALAGDVGSGLEVDARIVRVGSDGEILWERDYGGGSHDTVRSVVALSDGGLAFAGQSFSTVERGSAWLVRLDSDGEVLWEHGFSEDYNASFNSLAVDGEQLVAAGSVLGDAWVARIDSTGELVEEAGISLGGNEHAHVAIPLAGGGLVLSGDYRDLRERPDFAPIHAWVLRVDSLDAAACID